MECNKDEAVRSKEIAEGKFLQHDLPGARKFALKARHLFPDLDGVHQLIAVLDVHIVAQEKLDGAETNWYGVLQVEPSADDATIRKQYRKLALLLHPDKNKAVGAEAAFKLISEAWGVLSDKNKKAAHDMRRSGNGSQHAKVTQGKGVQAASNGSYNFTRSATTSQPQPQSQPQTQPQPQPQPQHHSAKSNTFWTSCPSCKMQFEYLRVYENLNLCCMTCRKPFLAREVHVVTGNTWWTPQDQESFRMGGRGAHAHVNGFTNGVGGNTFPNGTFPWGVYGNGTADQAAAAAAHVHQTYEKVRQARVEAQKEARKKEQKEKDQKNRERELEKKAKTAARAKEVFERLMARAKAKSEQAAFEKAAVPGHKAASEQTGRVEGFASKKGQENPNMATDRPNHGNREEGLHNEFSVEPEVEVPHGELKMPFQDASRLTPRRSPRCKRNESNIFASDHEIQDDSSPSKKARVDMHSVHSENDLKEHTGHEENVIYENLNSCGANIQRSCAQTSKMGQKLESNVECKEAERDLNATNVEGGMKQGDQSKVDMMNSSKLYQLQGNSSCSAAQPVASEIGDCIKNILGNCEIDLSKSSSNLGDDATMDVPDPDFYEFDKDRTENHFAVGQIWAVYDDDDGMPRYYTKINKIFSVKPFRVSISWLEPRLPSKETVAWLESGFSYTCGEYKIGKQTVRNCVNTFSHLVTFEKGQKGLFRIYPQKGDIWALYKGWNIFMKADGNREYEMVEVLTDYNEAEGVRVVSLVKVENFKTVFKKQVQVVRWISPQELLRFSHRVPAHGLTSEDVPSVPEGSWELDPASTPLEFITWRPMN